MATITNLKKQVRSDRISVYVDDKFSFGVSAWQLSELKLSIGMELDKNAIHSLKQQADFGKLYDKTLSWVLLRPRSAWELEQYLRRKTTEAALQEDIIARIADTKYVDDAAFARSWVANRRQHKSMSRRRIEQELRAKRVDPKIIEEVLSEDQTSDTDSIKKLIEKKQRMSRYKDPLKLRQYLARQGYNYDVITQALREIEDDDSA